jgi:putative restriction endonuclease
VVVLRVVIKSLMNDSTEGELRYRLDVWDRLVSEGGPRGVTAGVLRGLGLYGGQQGIWVDNARTGLLTEDGIGITVSLLHTGRSYPDELSEDGLIYHYPSTDRLGARDLNEISATKRARELRLPLLVITYPSPGSSKRDVHLAWVEDWDDEYGAFLVAFGDEPPPASRPVIEEEPFQLEATTRRVAREVGTAPGQQRFKFRVVQRYGARCAVCDMDVPEVLDAAHIRPRQERGSDDPRNGLVLCALHHRALDAGLFAIQPDTLQVHCRPTGPGAGILGIVHTTLDHLHRKPHRDALQWLWDRWEREH